MKYFLLNYRFVVLLNNVALNLQDWRKSDSPLSDDEMMVSASDLSMEKAEALMMFDTGKEKEVDAAGQNEINTELGRD